MYHLYFLNAQAKSQTLATGRRSLSATAASPAETAAFPDYVLRAPLNYITTLDSNLRVASEYIISGETATVGVSIDASYCYKTTASNTLYWTLVPPSLGFT